MSMRRSTDRDFRSGFFCPRQKNSRLWQSWQYFFAEGTLETLKNFEKKTQDFGKSTRRKSVEKNSVNLKSCFSLFFRIQHRRGRSQEGSPQHDALRPPEGSRDPTQEVEMGLWQALALDRKHRFEGLSQFRDFLTSLVSSLDPLHQSAPRTGFFLTFAKKTQGERK